MIRFWRVVVYRWCPLCNTRIVADDTTDDHCAVCAAELRLIEEGFGG